MTTAHELLQPDILTEETIGGLRVTGPAEEDYINLLVYGEPGVGKTRFAGSSVLVPEMEPVLFLDFEGGTLSLASDYQACRVVRAMSWDAVAKLYNDLYDNNPYRTVVVDSLTEVQKFCMHEIMRDVVRKDDTRDPDIASLREWGKQGEQMRRFVRALRDLPCNVIFTALNNETRDERTGLVKMRPSLPGQMKGEVAGYVDILVYMYKKEIKMGTETTTKTLILTEGTERQLAKDRSGRLPALMEAPTMQDIYNTIYGKDTAQ